MLKSAETMTNRVLQRRDQILEKPKKKTARWIPAAAGLALAALAVYAVAGRPWLSPAPAVQDPSTVIPSAQSDSGGSGSDGDAAGYGRLETDGAQSAPEAAQAEQSPEPVLIPAVELEPPREGAAADRIGLVVYHGAVYTAGEALWMEDARQAESLLGEYLGRTLPIVDCFTHLTDPENKWQELELASTFDGDLYTVQGYDPGFRLAVVTHLDGGEEPVDCVQFMENLNGIALYTGENLFGEERLNVDAHLVSAAFQTHEDWDNGRENWQPLDLADEPGRTVFSRFLRALYQGGFEDAWETDPDIYGDPERQQLHLHLRMDDGTTVELRLWSDGHVGYQPLGWILVKLTPEEVAGLMDLCR